MRAPAALAALVLAATTLTACGSSGGSGGSSGGNSTDDYCKELKADKSYFTGLDSNDVSKFDTVIEKFHSLAKNAPDAVAADWKVLDEGLSKAEADLKAAGLTFDQLAKVQTSGKLPDGVDQAKLQKVVADFQAMASGKAETAQKAITKHAKSECKVDLGS